MIFLTLVYGISVCGFTPIPVLNTLFFDTDRFLYKNMIVKVIDLYGRNVLTSTYHYAHNKELDVSSLAAGTYILQLNLGERRIVKKFSKQTLAR